MTTPRRKRGAPRLKGPPLAAEVREELIKLAQTGVPDKVLAQAVGIPPTTWSTWKGREERGFVEFFAEVERARARGDVALMATIRRAAGEGDWRAARYILACRHPELSERRALEMAVTHQGQDPIAAGLAQLAAALGGGE